MITTHDGESAVFKATEFLTALKDGQIPPRWAMRLNYGLGQPTFVFTYPLPYWIMAGMMSLGLSAVSAFKLTLAVSFPLGAYFCWIWLSKRFSGRAALAGGLIYAYLPYHFLNVYVRGAVGEVVAATLLPLSFWALDKKSVPLISICIALTVLAHPFYGMVFGLIWLLYSKKNFKNWVGIVWGYLIASFYLIPAWYYKPLTHLGKLSEYFDQNQSFIRISDLFYSPWNFEGVSAGGRANFSTQMGMVVLVLFLGWWGIWLFRKSELKTEKHYKDGVFFGVVALLAVFMTTQVSLPVWNTFPVLKTMQFPWRWLFAATFAATFCGTYFVEKIKKFRWGVFLIIMITLVVSSRGMSQAKNYYNWEDPAAQSGGYRGTFTLLLEETPKWHSPYDEYNQLHVYEPTKTEKGDFVVQQKVRKTNYHQFEVETPLGGILSDKTHWWPGWEVDIDKNKTEIFDPENKYSHGLITFEVPPGKHILEVRMVEPLINKFANTISLTAFGLAIWGVISSRYGKKQG